MRRVREAIKRGESASFLSATVRTRSGEASTA
jgi:hypothetical protein